MHFVNGWEKHMEQNLHKYIFVRDLTQEANVHFLQPTK